MLATVGIVFLEFEPYARRYVNYIVPVPSSNDEWADHTVLFSRRRCRGEKSRLTVALRRSSVWRRSLATGRTVLRIHFHPF